VVCSLQPACMSAQLHAGDSSGTHAEGGVSAFRAVQHSMKIKPVCGAAFTADDPSRVSTRHHRCSG
jgi:hypothetical protein